MSLKDALQQIKAQQLEILALRQAAAEAVVVAEENKALRLKVEKAEQERDQLRMQISELLRRAYGRKSEKENPDQRFFEFMALYEEAEAELLGEAAREAELQEKEAAEEAEEAREEKKQKKRRGRKRFSEHLPVVEEVLDVLPQDKTCSCCGQAFVQINEKVTDVLEYQPARVFIRRIRRPIYISPHEDPKGAHSSVIAPLPPLPIDRGMVAASLLAYLIVSKYGDHLPLYRLERIFEREGLEISRSTISSWLGEASGLLEPLYNALKQTILLRKYLQADETPVRVLDRNVLGRCVTGFLWVYAVPWEEIVFDFQRSRSRAGPSDFLAGFQGALQTDGYAGYNEVERLRSLVRLGCWAHVRRGFYKAKRFQPAECIVILGLIQKLYRIERRAKEAGLGPEARVELRRQESRPVLEMLKEAIQAAARRVLPESALGKAAQYALDQWDRLERYVEIGEAEIDNNSVESGLRGVAVGRKSWLFLGHPEGGGQRAEVFYSLVETCKRLGVNPYEYLRDVIDRVSTHPASRIQELLPRAWQAARQQAAAPTAAPTA